MPNRAPPLAARPPAAPAQRAGGRFPASCVDSTGMKGLDHGVIAGRFEEVVVEITVAAWRADGAARAYWALAVTDLAHGMAESAPQSRSRKRRQLHRLKDPVDGCDSNEAEVVEHRLTSQSITLRPNLLPV